MARRTLKGPTFTPAIVEHSINRMVDEAEKRRASDRQITSPSPITLSTGRWIRCSDCGGKGVIGWIEANAQGLAVQGARASGVRCPRCRGDGEVVERASA